VRCHLGLIAESVQALVNRALRHQIARRRVLV
jgi:hypothetical protein